MAEQWFFEHNHYVRGVVLKNEKLLQLQKKN